MRNPGQFLLRISRREFLTRSSAAAAAISLPSLGFAAPETDARKASTVRIDTAQLLNSFDPDQALGSSMDILSPEVIEKIYTPPMIKECLSAGWGPITYRQNTELQGAAWHWNPKGRWSDPQYQSGYFIGDSEPAEGIRHSFGYPLPHRGQTRQGGSERGYSRMTDGDPNTYWKSNPYLTQHFTGETDRPQWVVIDLGAVEQIHLLRIYWADPYARAYKVQYWAVKDKATESSDPMERPLSGTWTEFPKGTVADGRGGLVTLELSPSPQPVRFLRIWMTESSNTTSTHDPRDPRSSLGFAIHEIYVGTYASNGDFIDVVQHRPDENQTTTYCSSADPWHSATDLNPHGDQTGLDLFFTSGITNNLPAMIPVAMVYGTPEDAAAQISYLKKRGYPISYIEMGEEPDGQSMLPEDYATLYLQFATAIHRVDPSLKLGGPIFTGVNEDIKVWPDEQGRTSWMGRFVDYLKTRGRVSDLAFVSFEHYPLPPCDITWSDLYREPDLPEHILKVWREDGVPENVPLFNTESNVTWSLSQAMTDIFSALWLADSVGAFFAGGGAAYYHSPIQPEPLRSGCHGWTTYGNFVADDNLKIRAHTAQYYASRLINLEWVKHRMGVHKLYAGNCNLTDGAGHLLITVYPLLCPDGSWSVMLINKDQQNSQPVKLEFQEAGEVKKIGGAVRVTSFGAEQYQWKSAGPNSGPVKEQPPKLTDLHASAEMTFTLPKASVTIVRGAVQ